MPEQTRNGDYGGVSVAELQDTIEDFMAPMRCTQPGRPAPGIEHCAACCMQTGYLASSFEEQGLCEALDDALDAIRALQRVYDE